MSLCINPVCPQPNHPENQTQQRCQCCGAELILQGRYRIMRLISDRSGFGRVYEAFESNIPKILKVLKPSHNQNPKIVELFEQEARVLSQLQHPGIPFVDESGCFQFRPTPSGPLLHCIIMEKIDGLNLKEWMQQQGNHSINAALALNWLTQLTDVLDLVHQRSYFHRDIKPENIMLRANGQLVLVDFGAAREMTCTYFARMEDVEGVTRVSSTGYTPPEQERGRAVPQSDFYALGCTFIFLLTGQRPMAPEIYNALTNQFNWRSHAPHVPAGLADLLDELTAARAIDRPQSTQVLRQRLAHLNATAPSRPAPSHSSAGSVTQADSIALTEPPQSLPRPKVAPLHTVIQAGSDSQTVIQSSKDGRRPWIAAALGILGLCAVGLAVKRWPWPIVTAQSQIEVPYTAVTTYTGHSGSINDLALTLDQTLLASGSDDRTVKLWDIQAGEERRSLSRHRDRVQAVAFSPDKRRVISGSGDGEIKVWDTATGTLLQTLTGHESAINDLKVTSDGRTLGSAGADKTIQLWDLETGERLDVLEGHRSYVNAIAFTPDGKTLISGSADRTMRIWTLETGEFLELSHHQTYINDVAVSPDGTLLASAGADDEIALWNLITQTPEGRLVGHSGYINALSISPDGKTLISSSADSTLKAWNLEQREALYTISWDGTLIDAIAVRFGNPYWQIMAGGKGSTAINVWRTR